MSISNMKTGIYVGPKDPGEPFDIPEDGIFYILTKDQRAVKVHKDIYTQAVIILIRIETIEEEAHGIALAKGIPEGYKIVTYEDILKTFIAEQIPGKIDKGYLIRKNETYAYVLMVSDFPETFYIFLQDEGLAVEVNKYNFVFAEKWLAQSNYKADYPFLYAPCKDLVQKFRKPIKITSFKKLSKIGNKKMTKVVCNKVETEAFRWYKNGDHPQDDCINGHPEGTVVRYFRHPKFSGDDVCSECDHRFHDHGFIDNGALSMKVCPGDWIVTTPDGYVAFSDKVFNSFFTMEK